MSILNWMPIHRTVQPIGLDIGHRSIKMVQLALDASSCHVVAAERASLDIQLDEGKPSEDRAAVIVRTIRQLLSAGAFRGRNVITAVPNDQLKITSLRLAETYGLDMDVALRREAAQRFALDPENDVVRYTLAGTVREGDDLKSEYILFAADSNAVKNHICLLEEAGLRPVGIDAAPCALFRNFERVMRRQEDRERTTIFLDIGHTHTTVVFGRAGQMCFVKEIAFGAARFNEAVAQKLDISVADAESLRLTLDEAESVDAGTRSITVEAIGAAAEHLAKEVSLCLRYHTVTFRGKRVERAVITGGGAGEQILSDVLRRHLAVQIDVAEPLRGFEIDDTGFGENVGTSVDLSLAVGLSLKGYDVSTEVDVDPEPERQQDPEPESETESSAILEGQSS